MALSSISTTRWCREIAKTLGIGRESVYRLLEASTGAVSPDRFKDFWRDWPNADGITHVVGGYMNPKAAALVSAIEHATRHMQTAELGHESPPLNPSKPWGIHCSAMFRETMRQLSSRGVKVSLTYTDEYADANTLGNRIMQAPGDWTEVPLHEVQSLANQGVIVVGVYVNSKGPGHLALAYPTEMKTGSAVFRDGNIHRHNGIVTPSSYGAALAERTFYHVLASARFFKYRHSIP